MRAAAFDLSSHIGIGVWDGVSQAPLLEKKRVLFFDRDEGTMLEELRKWLGRFIAEHRPEVIGVEAPAMSNKHTDLPTIYRQAMIRGMVLWGCKTANIPAFSIPASTWRKTFLGFGTTPRKKGEDKVATDWKKLSTNRCRALGWEFPDHNAAEAGGVLDHLLRVEMKINPPWRDGEGLLRLNL